MKLQKPNIALIGGTGKIGTALVGVLLNEGYRVRLLVRNPEKISLKSDLVTIIKGDAREISCIRELIGDSDVLINLIGQSRGEPPLFSKVADNVTKVLTDSRISRYIVIAGLGMETPKDKKKLHIILLAKLMRVLFPAVINDKKKEYKIISNSNLDWTIIRIPKVLLKDSSKGFRVNEYDCPSMSIFRNDLVNFIIEQIYDIKFYRKAPFVAK
ncbi:MAG TPA: NAD(P)H-binding protein [Bacteroidales bacterium]|nr:NAD(P)H-binding protein [Bacteroidales bacterium]